MAALGWASAASVLPPSPTFPEPLRYIWDWFQELRAGVQGNGMTFPVITWTELDAWARRTGQDPSPRDARVIIALGNLWAGIMGEKKPDASKS